LTDIKLANDVSIVIDNEQSAKGGYGGVLIFGKNPSGVRALIPFGHMSKLITDDISVVETFYNRIEFKFKENNDGSKEYTFVFEMLRTEFEGQMVLVEHLPKRISNNCITRVVVLGCDALVIYALLEEICMRRY